MPSANFHCHVSYRFDPFFLNMISNKVDCKLLFSQKPYLASPKKLSSNHQVVRRLLRPTTQETWSRANTLLWPHLPRVPLEEKWIELKGKW